MRSYVVVVFGGVLAITRAASADSTAATGVAATTPPASPSTSSSTNAGEAGIFVGGFISNFYDQFYDVAKFPTGDRPQLHAVSPELGVRYAYLFTDYIGAEAEASMIVANTRGMDAAGVGPDQSAKIYNVHAQAIFQLPIDRWVTPFVAAGVGAMHTSSDWLGSDTDFPIHVGAGARFYLTDQIALRADFRYLRGPSEQAPYTLNAGYAEFGVGVSFVPHVSTHVDAVHVDGDRDGDGIPDSVDKCPDQPEDKDMFQDEDGCPDPDNDGDGIPDTVDKCPNEPEDKDGFEDLDGCPDPDNDKDGIPDIKDKCPNEPETINGFQDEDGCPDKGDGVVVLSPDRLDLLVPIKFQHDKLARGADNTSVLEQIGATLRAHAEIVRLRVTVHVQPGADADKDQVLSDTRAKAVLDWLVHWGVDAKRLEPRGFGGSKPLVPADQKGAAQVNDRVELIILERK